MADNVIDRGGEIGPVDAVPAGSATMVQEKSGVPWATLAIVGAMLTALGVLCGVMVGYSTFHKSAAAMKAGDPAKAAEHSVDDVMRSPAAQRAALADAVGGSGQVDVFGRPIKQEGQLSGVDVNGQPVPQNQGQMTAAQTAQAQRIAAARSLADSARRSPIMAFGSTSQYAGTGQASGGQSMASGAPGTGQATVGNFGLLPPGESDGAGKDGKGAGSGKGATDFSDQLSHQPIQTVRATMVSNRSMLLAAGTVIPCTLQTAINSTQAGYVSCVINHDVFSEDGRVVLLDKGTKVLGQYSGGIAQGQARLFVLWTRALSPRGVAIDLGSPAADSLGRAGVAGGVDSQFWARFGAALMMSVLEDLSDIAGRAVANTGTYTAEVPSTMGQTVLQSTMNIKPILKKNQGDTAAIFVAKDFDFSPVYQVGLRR